MWSWKAFFFTWMWAFWRAEWFAGGTVVFLWCLIMWTKVRVDEKLALDLQAVFLPLTSILFGLYGGIVEKRLKEDRQGF
jgi:hypothetical protein